MSERKTTEIKLRVTPVEKNSWQFAAEDEGIGLSELIRREMNARAAAPSNHETLERSTSAEVGVTPGEGEGRSSGEGSGRGDVFDVGTSEVVQLVPVSRIESVEPLHSHPDEPGWHTADELRERAPKPWMFEARSSG